MHTNGQAPPPSAFEDPLYSPPASEHGGPDSDFEIEDDALLGTHGQAAYYRARLKQESGRTWKKAYRYVANTRYGRQGDEYIRAILGKAPRRNLFISVGAVILLLLCIVIFSGGKRKLGHHRSISFIKNPFCRADNGGVSKILPKKPTGMKIYGLVFAGRKPTIEILDCYLRKNLVVNGGWFDEVHFLINTPVQEDRDYIAELLPQVPQYRGIVMDEGTEMWDFESVWRQGLQHSKDDLYIKIDDDLVYMSETCIEEMVTSMLDHPEAYVVLGNLIDSASLGWVQHRHGAMRSYLPEAAPPDKISKGWGPDAWRESELPTHPYMAENPHFDGEEGYSGPFYPEDDSFDEEPPYENARWLPLRDNDTYMAETPIFRTSYMPSFGLTHWQLGAQQHYSFFSHLEADDFTAYHFGHHKTGLWNMRYDHANINLMAIWANDVLDHLPFEVEENDEAYFSMSVPRRTRRQTYIQTRAIASHHSFGPQHTMYQTDILSRYRAYANEHVCKDVGLKIPPRENWTVAAP